MADKHNKLEQLTESLWLKLGNRVLGLFVVPIMLWGLHTLAMMHDDNIKFAAQIDNHTTQLANHETRIDSLESSRRADISVSQEWKKQ